MRFRISTESLGIPAENKQLVSLDYLTKEKEIVQFSKLCRDSIILELPCSYIDGFINRFDSLPFFPMSFILLIKK